MVLVNRVGFTAKGLEPVGSSLRPLGTGPAPSGTPQTIVECKGRDRKLPDKQALPYLSSRWAGSLSGSQFITNATPFPPGRTGPARTHPESGCFC